jgi:hypothetical protein
VDHHSLRKSKVGGEKQFTDSLTEPSCIVEAHEGILVAHDWIFNLTQAELQTDAVRAIEVATAQHDVCARILRRLAFDAEAETHIGGFLAEAFQRPRCAHTFHVQGKRDHINRLAAIAARLDAILNNNFEDQGQRNARTLMDLLGDTAVMPALE